MKLAFCLFKYFPYGGLQRDFLRIAKYCVDHGHKVIVYTMAWEGEQPDFLEINILKINAFSNHNKALSFSNLVLQKIDLYNKSNNKIDLIMGFNKMPGLDIYYCADSCYTVKTKQQKTKWINKFYKLSNRYRIYKYLEQEIFDKDKKTKVLFISGQERNNYRDYYNTNIDNCYLLPPNISKSRFKPILDNEIKQGIKTKIANLLNIDINNKWLLMVGSGFRTKGVDRSIELLKFLTKNNIKTNLIIIGQDKPNSFYKQAVRLDIEKNVRFLPGRDDISDFMAVCDLLVHPAYRENTGTVILESIIMGLPVVASGICGYAKYIDQSQCGIVVPEPFEQDFFNKTIIDLLNNNHDKLINMYNNGLRFRESADIYDADSKILEIIENV